MSQFATLLSLAGSFPKPKKQAKGRDPVKYKRYMKLYMRRRREAERAQRG